MMVRRKFLGALGLGAVAAPLAGQQIINTPAQFGAPAESLYISGFGGGGNGAADPRDLARRAFANPQTLSDVRALLFEKHQIVSTIDHDIASKKSFSLAAKIAFQRQRNVERDIQEMMQPWVGGKIQDIIRKATGLFG